MSRIFASGSKRRPFSTPSAASSPYIGRYSSGVGSLSITACSRRQYSRLSSQRSGVLSIVRLVTSTNGSTLSGFDSGYTLTWRSASNASRTPPSLGSARNASSTLYVGDRAMKYPGGRLPRYSGGSSRYLPPRPPSGPGMPMSMIQR